MCASRDAERNWLDHDQAKELLAVPDQDKLIGKCDHALLTLLLGCGLRSQDIVERDGE
ncbi:phage integrase family protein (plasmid) [Acidisarcina polymorpha]|uniref:Phage integrase family protein n=1 Tax=Acidisarcina polymorpha TaxID=2211140 RepID=A0A2Z5GBC7_9BACT|nr:hypothetical protein [Acidisarcina polymorpha]AXC15946.1 phage integrase family protein [Acidisarcina polymorpha]